MINITKMIIVFVFFDFYIAFVLSIVFWKNITLLLQLLVILIIQYFSPCVCLFTGKPFKETTFTTVRPPTFLLVYLFIYNGSLCPYMFSWLFTCLSSSIKIYFLIFSFRFLSQCYIIYYIYSLYTCYFWKSDGFFSICRLST